MCGKYVQNPVFLKEIPTKVANHGPDIPQSIKRFKRPSGFQNQRLLDE